MKHKPRTLAEFFGREGAPTQDAIARAILVTPAYVSLIVAGRRWPSYPMALEIEALTGVPAISLVSERARRRLRRAGVKAVA